MTETPASLIIFLILHLFSALPVTQRLLHGLQLDGYAFRLRSLKNKRFLKSYLPASAVPLIGIAVLGVLYACGVGRAAGFYTALSAVVLGGASAFFAKPAPAKKKLVYTNRVKRLTATATVLPQGVLAAGAFGAFGGAGGYADLFLICLYPIVFPLFFAVAHHLVLPFENLNRRRYAVRAAKTLAARGDLIKIGITGSFGKTSVKNFLNAMLQKRYNTLMTESSYNTPMGIALTVKELQPHHEVFIAEMGARKKGDIKALAKMTRPDHAIITGAYPQHMKTFKTFENVLNTKLELAAHMKKEGVLAAVYDCCALRERIEYLREADDGAEKAGLIGAGGVQKNPRGGHGVNSSSTDTAQRRDARVVESGVREGDFSRAGKGRVGTRKAGRIGAGDAKVRTGKGELRKGAGGVLPEDVIFAGLSPEAHVYADNISASAEGSRFRFVHPGGETEMQTRVLGRHNIMNIVTAAALALKLGISPFEIREVVAELKAVPHRLELIDGGGVTVIDDSFNSNIEGTKAAFDVIGLFSARKVLLTPGLVELGNMETEANEDLGRRAAAVFDAVLLIGKRATAIKRGLLGVGFAGEIKVYGSLKEAQEDFKLTLEPGDVLLIENDLPDNYD
ncbi:MAG: UDP-N-acetylmuramoyl-tripeptide--D-alanyl-D-alanine ligase [Clostridiaceae bacterium]|jgi:UDP-N-acetylmuramyl pentapeptide synthase|nr:UDP-N-acetylmuramoyl-tripeptide--D-alanyl-D-alanine ligase [Clostridiaceae bacterium]